MYSAFRLAAKYIRYYITASSGRGHGIHSPFVFDFIVQVLHGKRKFYAYEKIEFARQRLLKDNRLLLTEDFGAGSVAGNHTQKSIAEIARNAAKSKKIGQLLLRISAYYRPAVMVELGTSLGLSAAYLALGNPAATLVTLEGSTAIASAARENFALLGVQHIETVTGNFDQTLAPVLKKINGIDLAFIDGNHRREPTLRYFEQLLKKINRPAVLIVDDIHWSREMETAWQEIKNYPEVFLTIDLFFLGLVFFSSDFKVKQHFVIRF